MWSCTPVVLPPGSSRQRPEPGLSNSPLGCGGQTCAPGAVAIAEVDRAGVGEASAGHVEALAEHPNGCGGGHRQLLGGGAVAGRELDRGPVGGAGPLIGDAEPAAGSAKPWPESPVRSSAKTEVMTDAGRLGSPHPGGDPHDPCPARLRARDHPQGRPLTRAGLPPADAGRGVNAAPVWAAYPEAGAYRPRPRRTPLPPPLPPAPRAQPRST